MGGAEKMAEDFTAIQDKGKSFRQSILSLLVQWRDFEGQFNLADKILNFSESLESRKNDLEQREKDILLFVEKKKKFLELKEEKLIKFAESLDSRANDLEQREKDILLFVEKKKKFLELKEEKLIKFVENYAQEVEKNFIVQEERARGLLQKLEFKKLEMVEIRDFVEKRLLEMGDRENHLVSVQDSLERKRLEIVEKENMFKERTKEVEFKVEELNLMIENIEFKEKQVDYIRQIYENQLNDLDMKEKKLENKLEMSERKENRKIEDREMSKQFVNTIQDLKYDTHCERHVRARVNYSLERERDTLHARDRVNSSSEQKFESVIAVSPNITRNRTPPKEQQKELLDSKETQVTLEKEKPTKECKISLEEKEEELRSEESKVAMEKETHKRGFNFKRKEVEESSKELQHQFSYHSRHKYPQRTMQYGLGTFHDPPYRNYFPRRFNGKRRRR